MFGIDWQELLVIVIVAVLVIGPKDLPLAMRTAGRWIAKMRRISGHFRTGIDTMIREAELEEMERKWADQNRKIMAEHPANESHAAEPREASGLPTPAPAPDPSPDGASAEARMTDQGGGSPAAAEEPELPLGQRSTRR